ncbi:MAG: ATP-binding cassette domain-containing protein [Candidatus Melainabacteria bacterium]|nr:ATP-binding cassette domain-containing protein [Candidatus Melainabacteria bacterium]
MPANDQTQLNVVDVTGLSHYFGRGALKRKVLKDVTFQLKANEIVILTGPSGSGKTTFLTLIGALRAATHGRVCVLGTQLTEVGEPTLVEVRKKVGYIFQQHNLLRFLTAQQNVCMSLELHGYSELEARRRAREFLAEVDLGEHMHKYPDQLSGGQRQRVAIARALAPSPKLVLADEPTAALDRQNGREVVTMMHDLARRKGSSIVIVTHDNRILDICDRTVHMEDGAITDITVACR